MSDIIIAILSTLLGSSTLSVIITWFLAKRKYNSEVDSNVIENMQKALDFYKNLCDDTNRRLDVISQQNETLSKQIEELKKEIMETRPHVCYNTECKTRKNNL